MTNFEKYKDELLKGVYIDGPCSMIRKFVLRRDECSDFACDVCKEKVRNWFEAEYEEPKVDWSKVEVDTPIYVRDSESDKWEPKYFSEYTDGIVYAWVDGSTSFSGKHFAPWAYAKLAEDGGVE